MTSIFIQFKFQIFKPQIYFTLKIYLLTLLKDTSKLKQKKQQIIERNREQEKRFSNIQQVTYFTL